MHTPNPEIDILSRCDLDLSLSVMQGLHVNPQTEDTHKNTDIMDIPKPKLNILIAKKDKT